MIARVSAWRRAIDKASGAAPVGAALLALALAPAGVLPGPAQAQTAQTGGGASAPVAERYRVTDVAANDVLNVRAGPGVENVIVGMLAPDALGIRPTGQVARAGDGGTWWQIADAGFPGGTGWVNARFLAPVAAPPARGPFRVAGIGANEVLYLRAAPSPDAAIVGMLAPDAEGIEGTGRTQQADGAGWVEVLDPAAPDGRGWARAAHLQAVGTTAASEPATEADPEGPTLRGAVEQFARVPGYREIDTRKLENAIWRLLPHAPDTAMAPGAALAPLVKAVLAVQAHEGALPHARYHLRYAQAEVTTRPGRPTERLSLIELRRFNLGPARHRQLQEIHGADNVAPAERFGEGPHVSWRIATRGLRGTNAAILAASRREIDAPERDCMGYHCLMGQGINDHLADWEMFDAEPAPDDFDPSYEPAFRGGPSTAAALDMLALHNRMAEIDRAGDARWRRFELRESVAPGEPFIDVIIETGLGQDAGVDVVLRDSELMDTSLETMWYRLVAFGEGQAARIVPGQAAEHRPGHQ